MVTVDNIAERSPLDRTIDLISNMTDEELLALESVAKVILIRKPAEHPYHRLTKDEFFSDVDAGIAEADLGMLEDAGVIADEVAAELGLARK